MNCNLVVLALFATFILSVVVPFVSNETEKGNLKHDILAKMGKMH